MQPIRQPVAVPQYPVYPELGLLGVVLGTLAAIAMVPLEYSSAGALRVSGLLLAAGLCTSMAAAVLRHPLAILRPEHLVTSGLVYWLLLDLIQGTYPLEETTRESVEAAFLAIGLFAGGFWVGAMLGRGMQLPAAIRKLASQDLSPRTLFGGICLAFALSLFRFAQPSGFNPLVMYNGLFVSRFAAPWARGGLGGWDAFIDHLVYFGYLLPTLTVILASRLGRWVEPRVIASIGMSLIISLFLLQGGNRRIIGTLFGGALLCWVLQFRKLHHWHLIGATVGVVIMLTVMQAMIEFRSSGFGSLISGEAEFQSSVIKVDDNFLRLCQLIDLIPERHPFVEEQQLVWTVIRPVPRILWPNKPLNPGFDLGEVVGLRGTSLTSTVIGELYMSYGYYAIPLGGAVYGILSALCAKLLTASERLGRLILFGLGCLTIFVGLRSMIELVLMSYMLMAWVGLLFIIDPERGRR